MIGDLFRGFGHQFPSRQHRITHFARAKKLTFFPQSNPCQLAASREQGFGARVARSVQNFEHVMRLEEMARQRMSRRAAQGGSGADTDTGKQGHHLRDLIISEASDWQVLTLYLAVHMQELRSAIGVGASNTAQLACDALEIHAPLAHRLGVHHLSAGLEDLAFKALYPLEYDEIRSSTEARMGVYQEVMETAKSAVSAALRKDKGFTSQVGCLFSGAVAPSCSWMVT